MANVARSQRYRSTSRRYLGRKLRRIDALSETTKLAAQANIGRHRRKFMCAAPFGGTHESTSNTIARIDTPHVPREAAANRDEPRSRQ
jgi:hypothetical protein